MIPQNPLPRSENEATLHAWRSEIARSAPTPWLAQVLAARPTDLLPRVALRHTQLRTLPRRTRRAWQRQLARSSDLTAILEEWSQRRAGRAFQRQLARSVAGAALLLALAQGVGHAATITVNTNKPGLNADGKCSLIEAILNANAGGQPQGDCVAGDSGANTIVLSKATHKLSAVYDKLSFLPLITSQITIEGHGAKITRKEGATPPIPLIAVSPEGRLTLKDVTLSGKNAGEGGGIFNQGTLTIENSTIVGHKGPYAGGGILNDGYSDGGTLTILNSTISGNTAGKEDSLSGRGGGIANYYGTVTILNSTISGNRAAGSYHRGGGILSYGGSLTITNSTISGNKAGNQHGYGDGGGISSYSSLTITNSTISGNQAGDQYGYGGGISHSGYGLATIENSTISGNRAGTTYGFGGGILNRGTMTITNSTISANKTAATYGLGGGIESDYSLTLHRSLISGNEGGHGPEVYDSYSVIADDFNLFGVNGKAGTNFPPGSTDIVPGVALGKILGALAANGGPTKTHALKRGSPAVDAVTSDPDCPITDQRGVARPQGSACDIGAFELQ